MQSNRRPHGIIAAVGLLILLIGPPATGHSHSQILPSDGFPNSKQTSYAVVRTVRSVYVTTDKSLIKREVGKG